MKIEIEIKQKRFVDDKLEVIADITDKTGTTEEIFIVPKNCTSLEIKNGIIAKLKEVKLNQERQNVKFEADI